MRFLVDESLSSRVAAVLSEAGHEAVHVGDLDLLGATDDRIMEAASVSGRVVVSADTDFGELLALNQRAGPSVIVLRRAPHRPSEQSELLLRALPALEHDLAQGAVVSLRPTTARVRRLPIPPTG